MNQESSDSQPTGNLEEARVAVVTGAARGIGAATVCGLARAGSSAHRSTTPVFPIHSGPGLNSKQW